MKLKKILLCTSSYKTGGGGIASYAHDFVNQFNSAYNIIIITHDNYTPSGSDIKIYHLNMNDFSINNAKKLLIIIDEEKPDIIFNSNFHLLSIISPFIPNNIKLISISHFVNDKLAWFAGFNAQYIDNIISLSTYGKHYLEQKFKIKQPDKISIIYNYIPSISTPNILSKINRNILKIVYPGGCSFYKSAEIVCKAILKLLQTNIEFELYWLGSIKIPGGNWKFTNTKSIRNILPNDYRIKQLGPVSREEAQKILKETNIFLLPSRGEGFPISLLEAMRGGCIPIISDAKHGSLDIITHKKNGIIIPQNSSQAIVNTLIDILKKHDQYIHIYTNSLDTINTQLNSHIWNKKMNILLQKENNHIPRKQLTQIKFFFLVLKARTYLIYHFIKDRRRQLYHFIYFRYLQYCLKH